MYGDMSESYAAAFLVGREWGYLLSNPRCTTKLTMACCPVASSCATVEQPCCEGSSFELVITSSTVCSQLFMYTDVSEGLKIVSGPLKH